MAGDWIKMRTDLYRDPKVCIVADYLMQPDSDLAQHINQNTQRAMAVTRNVMRNVTVGALVTVWGVMRLRGKRAGDDLVVRHASLSVIDDLAELAGFGEALASVDWVEETDEGIVFPNFFEHYNVDPNEDKQSAAAERQRRYRERKKSEKDVTRDATVTSQSNAREEKRREEVTTTDVVVTPPPKIPHHQSLIDNWQPSPATIEALTQLHRIPGQFIAEQLVEFKTYWRDRADPKTSWDAAFLKRCPQQWKSYGAEWRRVADDEFLDKHTDKTWAENLQ